MPDRATHNRPAPSPDALGRMAQHFEGLPDRRPRDWWPVARSVALFCAGAMSAVFVLAWGVL